MPECGYNELYAGSLILAVWFCFKATVCLCVLLNETLLFDQGWSPFSLLKIHPRGWNFRHACSEIAERYHPVWKQWPLACSVVALIHTVNVHVIMCVYNLFVLGRKYRTLVLQVSVLVIPGEKKPKHKAHDCWIMWTIGS